MYRLQRDVKVLREATRAPIVNSWFLRSMTSSCSSSDRSEGKQFKWLARLRSKCYNFLSLRRSSKLSFPVSSARGLWSEEERIQVWEDELGDGRVLENLFPYEFFHIINLLSSFSSLDLWSISVLISKFGTDWASAHLLLCWRDTFCMGWSSEGDGIS